MIPASYMPKTSRETAESCHTVSDTPSQTEGSDPAAPRHTGTPVTRRATGLRRVCARVGAGPGSQAGFPGGSTVSASPYGLDGSPTGRGIGGAEPALPAPA